MSRFGDSRGFRDTTVAIATTANSGLLEVWGCGILSLRRSAVTSTKELGGGDSGQEMTQSITPNHRLNPKY
ncbi:hypothetical protein Pla52n_58700 [Stieleria varia]|uniref:Uncharacterized protein n=1 Tax=Stieleria varia TaxID=2528005 RepID=A0A5C6A466_9BACT|nr:hypothetical protein Pla52n_58700 [Stieleria varia]